MAGVRSSEITFALDLFVPLPGVWLKSEWTQCHIHKTDHPPTTLGSFTEVENLCDKTKNNWWEPACAQRCMVRYFANFIQSWRACQVVLWSLGTCGGGGSRPFIPTMATAISICLSGDFISYFSCCCDKCKSNLRNPQFRSSPS